MPLGRASSVGFALPLSRAQAERFYDAAPLIHALADTYGVDPYAVAFEWTYERFDFNRAVFNRYQEFQSREQAKRDLGRKRR